MYVRNVRWKDRHKRPEKRKIRLKEEAAQIRLKQKLPELCPGRGLMCKHNKGFAGRQLPPQPDHNGTELRPAQITPQHGERKCSLKGCNSGSGGICSQTRANYL